MIILSLYSFFYLCFSSFLLSFLRFLLPFSFSSSFACIFFHPSGSLCLCILASLILFPFLLSVFLLVCFQYPFSFLPIILSLVTIFLCFCFSTVSADFWRKQLSSRFFYLVVHSSTKTFGCVSPRSIIFSIFSYYFSQQAS